ncbi:MAG TPA: 2,3,4,5-tetrahydropyridine-2,6-dicarboxylate N-succinyltransferase [Candidatus Saccharimonadales bacterium]|nr:2,3,4,5-tetrahydropyridine-2,6-dicarboxylate N-succinyltransferase [Candidatus Saccharimonadales bacterium]
MKKINTPNRSVEEVEQQIVKFSQIESAEELRNMPEAYEVFSDLLSYLNMGVIRSAQPIDGSWKVNTWVKEGIVRVGFRLGKVKEILGNDGLEFSDKDTLPVQGVEELAARNVRIVPGGSSIRSGSYLGDNVIMMPPAYVNIGAYVGKDSMVDSLVLVGTCAQIGERVHLAAGAIIGGVLEPSGAKPCIVGDDAFVGAYAGIFGGVELGKGVVMAPKTVITDGTEVWEAIPGKDERKLPNDSTNPIRIPDRALVIPGTIQLRDKNGQSSRISKNIAIIRGYYPQGGNPKVALNELLRQS